MKRDKKEISRLRREKLQLRKMLDRLEQEAIERQQRTEDEQEREFKNRGKADKVKCPKCKSEMELIDAGPRGIYKICTNSAKCWHREKHK